LTATKTSPTPSVIDSAVESRLDDWEKKLQDAAAASVDKPGVSLTDSLNAQVSISGRSWAVVDD
jgi:hypothetical protein